jgi:hypothetical protein
MTSSVFLDINVWLALSYPGHQHHERALAWFSALDQATQLVFCRHTQLGLFRLLTTEAILGTNVRTQSECWGLFDQWINSGKATLAGDPLDLDGSFRARAHNDSASPKAWADAYLAAFAESGSFTLVTFDKLLAGQTKGSVLLA